jgi:putative chitinase
MLRAVEIVAKVSPHTSMNYLDAFDAGDSVLAEFAITTPLRLAHFLAQTLYETGGGTVLFENMAYTTAARLLQIFGVGHHSAAIRPDEVDELLDNPQALAERVYGLGNPPKAAELGNRLPGDGFRYRGGGLLQTTGGGNYRRLSEKSGIDFFGDPALIVAPENALQPAVREWSEGGLNEAADRNDIRMITRVINGGFNGLEGRQALFDRIWPVVSNGAAPMAAWQVARSDGDTAWLQSSLNELGARPPLVVDGRYGPATAAAVRQFQQAARLTPDSVAGEVTRAALRLQLAGNGNRMSRGLV